MSWKTSTIEVTEEDIANGKPQDCELCALALAAKRALGYPVRVYAGSLDQYTVSHIRKGSDTRQLYIEDSSKGRRGFNALNDWLEEFDNGKIVEPITVRLGLALS